MIHVEDDVVQKSGEQGEELKICAAPTSFRLKDLPGPPLMHPRLPYPNFIPFNQSHQSYLLFFPVISIALTIPTRDHTANSRVHCAVRIVYLYSVKAISNLSSVPQTPPTEASGRLKG